MEQISGIVSGEVKLPASVDGAEGASKLRKPEEAAQAQRSGYPLKPVMDEYIPEEKQEPGGRYWMERDEEGVMKVHFDDPDREKDDPGIDGPGKNEPDREPEICRGSTDRVDREIEKLKEKKEELERQLNAETDEAKRRELEKELSQVERELGQKDNDTYRRRHTVFSFS